MLRLRTWRLSTSSFILHVYMRLLNFIRSMHFAVIRARISRIHRLAVRLLLIFDFSSGYLVPIDLSFRHIGWSSCFGGSLLLYLVVLKTSLPAWGSLLISASLGGETYRVSLSAMSISRCRAGEWPNDNIMFIVGRSHLFPGLHLWAIFCQWNRIITIVRCAWSVASYYCRTYIPK